MKQIGRILVASVGERRGVAALEFALVAAPFLLLLFSIMTFGLHFYFQQSLEYALGTATRQVQLGQIGEKYTQQTFVSQVLCTNFAPACASLYVDLHPVTNYQQLTAAGVVDAPDSISTSNLQFCPGSPGQLMYAHVIYLANSAVGNFLNLGVPDAIIANTAFVNENPGGTTVQQQNGC